MADRGWDYFGLFLYPDPESRGHHDPGSMDAKGRDKKRELNTKDAPGFPSLTLVIGLNVDH